MHNITTTLYHILDTIYSSIVISNAQVMIPNTWPPLDQSRCLFWHDVISDLSDDQTIKRFERLITCLFQTLYKLMSPPSVGCSPPQQLSSYPLLGTIRTTLNPRQLRQLSQLSF